MATYTAVANITNDADWNTAAKWTPEGIPGAGDTVETGAYVITFETGKTCALFKSTSTGYFVIPAAMTITGNIEIAGTAASGQFRCTLATGTAVINGNVSMPGTSANVDAVRLTGAGNLTVNGNGTGSGGTNGVCFWISSAGTLTINGTATGGAGSGANAIYSNGAGGTVIATAVTGGAGANSQGCRMNAASTAVIGTATGGTVGMGVSAESTSNVTIDLAIGDANVGVTGGATSTTKVKRIQYGTNGESPTAGRVKMLADATNSAKFIHSVTGDFITLTPQSGAVRIEAISGGIGG